MGAIAFGTRRTGGAGCGGHGLLAATSPSTCADTAAAFEGARATCTGGGGFGKQSNTSKCYYGFVFSYYRASNSFKVFPDFLSDLKKGSTKD